MDTFHTLAEVSVAMAGFSSIVVMFKRREAETWRKADADRFHGMILHSFLAIFFSLVPFVFTLFDVAASSALRWCAGLLAVVTGLQTVVSFRLEASSAVWIRLQVIVGGLIVVVLQSLGGLGLFPDQILGVYFLGVFWHLVQASALFVMLIWIPKSLIETDR